jgi:hypothetical protein
VKIKIVEETYHNGTNSYSVYIKDGLWPFWVHERTLKNKEDAIKCANNCLGIKSSKVVYEIEI